MSSAHPNISITDESLSRDDIEKYYSEKHADVWELVQSFGVAAEMPRPVFDVVSLAADCANHSLQARGLRQVESGWLALFPEEEAALSKKLPEVPALLMDLAGDSVFIEEAAPVRSSDHAGQSLNPAAIIQIMKNQKIGRPSTYAKHIEKLHECVEHGFLVRDGDGGFRLADSGRLLLKVLVDPTLPHLGKGYTIELEADLDAIERGENNSQQILQKHLQRLPGIEGNHSSAAPDLSNKLQDPIKLKTPWQVIGAELPEEIDPDLVLSPKHPLRLINDAFNTAYRELSGSAIPNRIEAIKRKLCRAVALGSLMGNLGCQDILERLRLDLGWRWVVGLSPTDRLCSLEALEETAVNEGRLVDKLHNAAKKAIQGAINDKQERMF